MHAPEERSHTLAASTQIALTAAAAIGFSVGWGREVYAQSHQQLTCPAGFAHDAGILRKTLGAAATGPNRPELDYAKLLREQARPLNTPSDQATCARLDEFIRIAPADQRSRTRAYFAIGDHYVVMLPRDPKTRPHSEFGSVVFLDRDMNFVVAWTM